MMCYYLNVQIRGQRVKLYYRKCSAVRGLYVRQPALQHPRNERVPSNYPYRLADKSLARPE